MEQSEKIYIATKAFDKGWTYDQLRYGDDMYGKEEFTDDVWEYVIELHDDGRNAFYQKYKEFKLY